MPKTINEVHLAGHVGRDADIRSTSTGKTVTKFSLATGGGRKRDGGEYPTEWHNVECWHDDAAKIKKGQYVELWGRIKTDSWDDKHGNKKYMTKIVAEKLQFEAEDEYHQAAPPTAFNQESIDDEPPF